MIVSDTLRAVVVAGIVVAALNEAVALLFALACLQAVIGTFFSPARMAMVPRVVPEDGLLAANSLGQATRMLAGVIGAAVTGVVAGVAGLVWPVFLIDAGDVPRVGAHRAGRHREAGLPEAAATAKAGAQGLGGPSPTACA